MSISAPIQGPQGIVTRSYLVFNDRSLLGQFHFDIGRALDLQLEELALDRNYRTPLYAVKLEGMIG